MLVDKDNLFYESFISNNVFKLWVMYKRENSTLILDTHWYHSGQSMFKAQHLLSHEQAFES